MCRSCACSPCSEATVPTACSSPETSASESSEHRFRGGRWVWTFEGGPAPYKSTIGHHIRFGGRQTGCCRANLPMWTVSSSNVAVPFQSSTDLSRLSKFFQSPAKETAYIANWLRTRRNEEYQPHEIGVFVRSDAEWERADNAIRDAELPLIALDEHSRGASGSVAVGMMHLAKGLEFRAVVVMACDDEVLPLQSRIENVPDEADLEDVYNTERHLLYVACTRARDHLLVTGVEPASEFLDDLGLRQ